MHEMGIAQAIMTQLTALADEHPGQRITRVKLVWGELQSIHEPSLREAMNILLGDGSLSAIQLELTCLPLQGQCKSCQSVFSLNDADFKCPACKADQFDILPDQPLTLQQIELTDAAPEGEPQ